METREMRPQEAGRMRERKIWKARYLRCTRGAIVWFCPVDLVVAGASTGFGRLKSRWLCFWRCATHTDTRDARLENRPPRPANKKRSRASGGAVRAVLKWTSNQSAHTAIQQRPKGQGLDCLGRLTVLVDRRCLWCLARTYGRRSCACSRLQRSDR